MKLASLVFALLFVVSLFTHFPIRVQAQPQSSQGLLSRALLDYEPPPNIGKPGRREGGGTRSPCLIGNAPPTALVPDRPTMAFGTTTAKYPTFLIYVPPIDPGKKAQVIFVLKSEEGEDIYQTSFTITGQGGILNISLPAYANLPPLEVNKSYQWLFDLVCVARNSASLGDIPISSLNGWIQRIDPSPNLMQQLEQARTPEDKVAVYAQNGIWYEALNTLVELRRANPNDRSLEANWVALLESVGLPKDRIPPEVLVQNSELLQQHLGKSPSI